MRTAVAVLALLILSACANDTDQPSPQKPIAADQSAPNGSPESSPTIGTPRVVRTIATGLEVPWGVTFLPDGTALVGERDSTRVLAITPAGDVHPVGTVEEASPQGEAGLLGLAASPSYANDRLVYAYVSTESDNRVVTMTYDGQRLGEPEPVLTGIPNGFIHDGGRLLFADDGSLFVSTGETGVPALAQDPDSLAGKILHITPDGRPAPDNPDPASPIWTTGHRNVQGLAFDDSGRLWATEFGLDTWDELNRVVAGDNYGWPVVEGRAEDGRFHNPEVTWRTADASPSGLAFLDGSLWAGALQGERLWEIPVTRRGAGDPKGWFVGDYGRIRTVTVTPEGNLWLTTSNRDGRGEPVAGDDRIIEVSIGSRD